MAEVEELTAKAFEKREKRERKRVRFSGDLQESDEEDDTPKQALFPKGKKPKEKQGPTPMEEGQDEGPILAADPRVAAKERATRRRDDASFENETGILEDVAGAEEEFEGKDEDEVNEIEPFNLDKEREEGYFDAAGNYVEYRNENDFHDAWLDSAEVDTRFAGKAGAEAAAAEAEPEELSAAEEAAIKRRIADSLESGETVLQALKRLGGERPGRGRGEHGRGRKGGPLKEQRMPQGTRALFDRLTEDAMKLLDNGEYGVYSEKKETFQREAEGFEALARLRSAPSNGASDMFADSDEDEPPAGPSAVEPAGSSQGLPANGQASSGPAGPSRAVGKDEAAVASDRARDRPAERGSANANGPGGASPAEASSDGQTAEGTAAASAAGAPAQDSGYVYDPSSGYYYNSDVGYYYDASTGLYCSASTGLWYRFDESANTYVEVPGV